MQPEESNCRSDTHLKFFLQPPLSLEQSRTGPKDASKSSTVSKYVDIMASSLDLTFKKGGGGAGGKKENKMPYV